jgi:adenine-specific DNA-methyltransferase
MAKKSNPKTVDAFKHEDEKRKNIPTAEYEPIVRDAEKETVRVAYERRNRDLDPQLVWRGKDTQDLSDLVVSAPPIYIQEKVHPKALIDELLRESGESKYSAGEMTADLFADFNGVPKDVDKTEFYQHDQNWTNRMILGDSLQVMASLAERERLRGKVQCIYFDPPYGIKFNSNFQWSTTSRDVKDGKADHITREPEQVKAFRDTWRDGIHSYLTYLRDRLTVARDLLTDSGSIFVQIGDENVHRVRALMDEVFGEDNFCNLICFKKTGGLMSSFLPSTGDYLVWYCRQKDKTKFRQPYAPKAFGSDSDYQHVRLPDLSVRRLTREEAEQADQLPDGWKILQTTALESANPLVDFEFRGRNYSQRWKTNPAGLTKLAKADRIYEATSKLRYLRYVDDFPVIPVINSWDDTGSSGYRDANIYVVQTVTKVIERCILMTTDPGDLVLDPTCGSGTTATVAEQWGRRWITIDTSRVALALARARIMGARYPFFLLADSREGQFKEAEVTRTALSSQPVQGNIRHGFVYERVPHITLKSIANNAEIDVIWEQWQTKLEPLREKLNAALKQTWQEWEIPREAEAQWPDAAKKTHVDWWQARIARQQEIDKSIAAKAEFEYLYDKPYEDKKKVRVAGPFTVESLSPHRMLAVGVDDEVIQHKVADAGEEYGALQSFTQLILENLRVAGVQQAHKGDGIKFSSVVPYPGGGYICAVGMYEDRSGHEPTQRKAGIFIGSEFGTVSRPDLVAAAREAADNGFDVLVACAFNYEAHTTEFNSLGKVRVLKARMNADLHMAEDLKATGKGNLFVVFGEPDIELSKQTDGRYVVKVLGVDVFHPQSGEVRSDGPDGIACWMIDTDYNEESFFVRHAYFLGANDPYSALKTSLKAEINAEAWATLNSDTSRPFDKPKSGRIAVKVINHLGDEVMKVFAVN